MQEERKPDVLKRLSYIEGHVAGIRKMVEEDKYCVDILRQTYAVRKAMEKLEALILEGHLRTCVPEGIKGGREEEVIQDTHVGLHHPQGKKVEWEKMFRHRDRPSLEPCEPASKTGPGGCRNHPLLRWREDLFR